MTAEVVVNQLLGPILFKTAIIAVGNWRSGVDFHRFTLADFEDEVRAVLQDSSLQVRRVALSCRAPCSA